MNPQAQFCPNMACSARGQVGGGNTRIHCRADGRYYCTVCHQRFSATAATAFHGVHTSTAVVVQGVPLLAYAALRPSRRLWPRRRTPPGGHRRVAGVRTAW